MNLRIGWTLLVVALATDGAIAAAPADDPALARSIEQLAYVVGDWSVTTEFLNPDGTVAKAVSGGYTFDWTVPNRVLSGRSEIPELEQRSAILFYVSEQRRVIEMVSVGADGTLWVMTGPLGEETRTTPPFQSQDGKDTKLRFTRYNVAADTFESKMEYTRDGGQTWLPGNHQAFRRRK